MEGENPRHRHEALLPFDDRENTLTRAPRGLDKAMTLNRKLSFFLQGLVRGKLGEPFPSKMLISCCTPPPTLQFHHSCTSCVSVSASGAVRGRDQNA